MKNMFLALTLAISLIACKKDTSPDPPPPPPPTNVPQVDNAVASFMTTHNVPGLSLAVTKNGKLVYAKSYGKADVGANTDVSNNSLFRIASVSKPVTGIAIMKMVEAGQLNLDAKVFGTGNILGTTYGNTPYGPNITNITVRQLLQHTAGGWPNDGNDPMFTNQAMNHAQLISWTLNNRPLTHTPGTNYAYSNFGYAVLGRVIEKISGQTYEQYVKTNVLQPAGITTMTIGGDTEADRKPNEVKYYGQGGQNPYIYKIARMDAHGGWIASATDLAKLLVRVDGFNTKPDILSTASINTMVAPSSVANYALGWSVNNANNWWHMGSLPGTATMIVRANNGFNWVILTNTRAVSNSYLTDLDGLLWPAVNNASTPWPDVDLF